MERDFAVKTGRMTYGWEGVKRRVAAGCSHHHQSQHQHSHTHQATIQRTHTHILHSFSITDPHTSHKQDQSFISSFTRQVLVPPTLRHNQSLTMQFSIVALALAFAFSGTASALPMMPGAMKNGNMNPVKMKVAKNMGGNGRFDPRDIAGFNLPFRR